MDSPPAQGRYQLHLLLWIADVCPTLKVIAMQILCLQLYLLLLLLLLLRNHGRSTGDSGSDVAENLMIETPGGDVRCVDLRASAIDLDGVPAVLVACWDVTRQRREWAQLLQTSKLAALGEMELDDGEQVTAEDDLARTLASLTTKLEAAAAGRDTGDLRERVVEIGETLRTRDQNRETALRERSELDLITRQNMMLASARTHRAAGSLVKALEVYESLLEIDESGKLARLLDDEIALVRLPLSFDGQRPPALAPAQEIGESDSALDAKLGGKP